MKEMNRFNKIFKTLMSLTVVIFITGCEIDSFAESDEHSFGEIIAPSNVQITANIVGQDADNPNGDGSGEVEFTVTADNAIPLSLAESAPPCKLSNVALLDETTDKLLARPLANRPPDSAAPCAYIQFDFLSITSLKKFDSPDSVLASVALDTAS